MSTKKTSIDEEHSVSAFAHQDNNPCVVMSFTSVVFCLMPMYTKKIIESNGESKKNIVVWLLQKFDHSSDPGSTPLLAFFFTQRG